jgi:hypothetical protein
MRAHFKQFLPEYLKIALKAISEWFGN